VDESSDADPAGDSRTRTQTAIVNFDRRDRRRVNFAGPRGSGSLGCDALAEPRREQPGAESGYHGAYEESDTHQ